MRNQVVAILLSLTCATTFAAAPVKVEDCHKKSEEFLKLAQIAKNEKERSTQLKNLLSYLEEVRKEYEEKFPDGGNDDEYKVSLFFHTLTPVVKISENKKDKATCEATDDRLRANDSQGRGDTAPLTKNAQIALDWLKILCK